MDDEELENQEESQSGSQNNENGSRGNIKDRAEKRQNRHERKADKFQNKSDKAAKKANKYSEKANNTSGRKSKRASKKSKKQIKKKEKYAKKAMKERAKAKKIAHMAAKLAKIIAVVGWILIIVLITVGLIVFILTGMGMITQGIKNIASSFFQNLMGIANGTEDLVVDKDIEDLGAYIREMDYDLFGYGFVTTEDAFDKDGKVNKLGHTSVTDLMLSDLDATHTADDKVYRNLIAYLVSDNYAYTIKNQNWNFKAAFGGGVGNCITGVFWDATSSFGTGLISLYTEKSGRVGDADEDDPFRIRFIGFIYVG